MPILFKITKDEKLSFLYGTIHSGEDCVCELSAETKNAFEQARYVLVESSPEKIEDQLTYLTLKQEEWKERNPINPTESYANYLNAFQIKKIVDLFQLTSCHDLFQAIEIAPMLLCTNIIQMQRQNLGLNNSPLLDYQIAQQAKILGKSLVNLDEPEDLAERIIGFAFDYKTQVSFATHVLPKYLANNEYLKQLYDKLVEKYLAGDCNEIINELNSDENEIAIQYLHSTVYARDTIFAEKMQPYLDTGEAFIAIGAGHLPGVISLLEKEGYLIEPIVENERLYSVQSLKNVNRSVQKANLLNSISYFMHPNFAFFFNASQKNTFTLQKEEFLIFLDLIKEEKFDKLKIELEIGSCDEKDWLIIHSILQEPGAPKSLTLTWGESSADKDIAQIVKLFKSPCQLEELNLHFHSMSDQSICDLMHAIKKFEFTPKLSIGMNWQNSDLHRELWLLLKSINERPVHCPEKI